MVESPNIAVVAALIGDPGRARILLALMGGQALTVSELAAEAGVGLPTASAHLARLEAGGLVAPRRQGRHKYFTLASEAAAGLIEALMGFAAGEGADDHGPARRQGPRDPALRQARVCYNHLAGDLGVQMFDSLMARGYLEAGADGLRLSAAGWSFATGLGIPAEAIGPGRPPLCRLCLDWSARRNHLGGRLGRAFLATLEARGWLRRVPGSRVLRLTPVGQGAFRQAFPGLDGNEACPRPDESLDAARL